MKKLLAMLLALMLLCGAAFAENAENAEDVKDAENVTEQSVETAPSAETAAEETAPAEEDVAAAPADEIKLEQHVMVDGLTFSIPKNWNYREIMEDEKEKGIFVQGYDLSRNMTLTAFMEAVEAQITPAMLTEAMNANPESFYTATVVTNQNGQELVLFITADGCGIGCIVLDGAGTMVTFLFRHADNSIVIQDEVLNDLMVQCAQSVCYGEPASAE